MLRGSKGERRQDDSQVSPGTTKKSWASAAGIGALQQNRARSGSHPQIRHLAMESHEGPVTKATMEEIRREAGSSHSNLRINSLNISAAEAAPQPLPPSINSPEKASRAESGPPDSAFVTRPDTSQGSTTPSSALTDDSTRAVFPLRTTSNVLAPSLPPKIDTLSPLVQRHALPLAKPAGPERAGYASPFTDDSDVSAPLGTAISAGTSDQIGFDLPAPPARQQPTAPAAEANKRVISERIKSLANRFSSSSLKEQAEPPSTPYAMQRRPSNTPSVSERVSLFDQQELLSNDPRLSGLFGKFGMASGRPGMHSRSSSVAGSISRSSDARSSIDGFRGPIGPSSDVGALRTPGMPCSPSLASKSTSLGDTDSDERPASRVDGVSVPASTFGPRTVVSPSNKSSNNPLPAQPTVDNKPSAVPTPSSYNNDSRDSVAADRQLTIAAGVQLNFLRPLSMSGTHTTNGGSAAGGGYRGVRSDGPGKRRGSIHSTFGTNEDGLYIITDPIDTTASHQPTPSPRTQGGSDLHASRVSSAATSPTGIQTSRATPVRRAGAVVTVSASHAGSLDEIQRSISAASHSAEVRPAVRTRSQSQVSAPRTPVLVGAHTEFRKPSTRKGRSPPPPGDTVNGTPHQQPTSSTLFGNLSRHIAFDPDAPTDSILARAVGSDPLLSDSGIEESGADYVVPGATHTAAMSALVEAVINTADAGKVLPLTEYEQCVREVPALKMRLQSARTRHSLEIRMRDTAKNLVDLNKGSAIGVGMFKGKHPSQAHVDDYNTASANVQQAEADVAELSAKLRVMEAALRDHQVAVLLSAVKTVVAEATHGRDSAHSSTSLLQKRVTELEQSVAASQAALVSERASLIASHAKVKLDLEEQIRSLQNKTHDTNARRVSREAEVEDPESPLARHSAGLTAERLAGELIVLKEQNQASERRSNMLETRLDEALLKAQGARQELDEFRRQAAEMTEVSRAKLEASRAESDACRQCVRAFSSGLGDMISPLRLLNDVHNGAEKLRSLHVDPTGSTSTPPITPTLKAAFALPLDTVTVETLESIVAGSRDASDFGAWDAERVASAMLLLGSTIVGCSRLYPEAMRVCDAYSQLQHDLGTEQRLREAQGLAITQQREKLSRATYLAESADQRVKEAVDTLAVKHAKEQDLWAEERQRLFDNIERLTQDVKERQAVIAARSIGHVSDIGSTSISSSAAIPTSQVPRTVIGSIEPMLVAGQTADAETEAIRQQLSSKAAECDQLRQDLDSAILLRRRTSEMDITISQLQRTEAALREQLAELTPLKEAHHRLLRDVELAKGKTVTHIAEYPSKEMPLGDNVRKLGDVSTFLASAATTAVEGASGEAPTTLAEAFVGAERGLVRCRSMPSLRHDHLCAFTPTGRYRVSTPDAPARVADAQTTTSSDMYSTSDSADVGQMLQAYSEKLMHKEDALRSREDELEAVCSAVTAVESALYRLLPSTPAASQAGFSSVPRSPANSSPQTGPSAWHSSASMSRSSLRNRSASFFQGLRTNYLGIGDGAEPSSPLALTIQTDTQSRPGISFSQIGHAQGGTPPAPPASGTTFVAATAHVSTSVRASGADAALLAAQGLAPLVQMVAAETKRLKVLVVDLEEQSRDTRVELLQAQGKLADLQSYYAQRSKQEDAVQQDITHVLGQISRLRTKVVQLEDEKAARESEASELRKRCREMEDTTAEKVLRLIVDRVGAGDFARQNMAVPASTEAEAAADRTIDEPKSAATLPAKFAALGSVSVSHPEAGEIRAEFNELLHQIIARRDEDIERIQALADVWRADARKASQANERKTWNMATRGIQTM
ncbi:hypothetical protein GGI17_005035 [Coemansia sp. S146]|nr:hypothetical protein GGI17_005035 [Coemansia sp. S146]